MAIDFSLNEAQKLIQSTAQNFFERNCPTKIVRELEASERGYSPEMWQQMAELGWLGITYPEEYGGPAAQWNIGVLVVDNARLHTDQSAFGKGRFQGGLSFPPSQPATEAVKPLVHFIQIKLVGIELVPDPFQGVVMLFVLGVFEFVEEVWVSVGTAAILGRAGTLPLHTSRIANAFFDS